MRCQKAQRLMNDRPFAAKHEPVNLELAEHLRGCLSCATHASANDILNRAVSVVNITSISGVVGMLGQSNYSASKAGMIGLTKSLAKEVASRKITVNALALGLVETEMASEMNAEFREKIVAQIPLARLGNVQEVAEIVCFLLSDSAAYITGQVIQADGGLAM